MPVKELVSPNAFTTIYMGTMVTWAGIIMGRFGLRYSNEAIEETVRLCLYHMYDFSGLTSEGKMRLFIARNYDIIDKLVLLMNADKKGSGLSEPPPVHRLTEIKEKMLAENTPIKQSDLLINGGDLLSMGIRGEQIGILLRDMHEKCIVEPRLNNREWLTEYAKRRAPKS